MRIRWRIAALKNGFKDATAYQLEFLAEVLGSAIVPAAIQWILWYAMFKVGGAETIAGLTYKDMLLYTFCTLLFSQIRGGNLDFELQEMIRSGSLSNYLLRPMGVIEFVWLRGIAPKLFLAAICLVIGSIAGFFMGLNPVRIMGGMLMALMGNIIHYQLSAALASAAFYWEEAYSVLMVKNMLVALLSGELLPLTLIPEQWAWVWKSLPFHIYVFAPAQFATGKMSPADFTFWMAASVGWMVVAWALIRLSWGVGMKRYLSLGG